MQCWFSIITHRLHIGVHMCMLSSGNSLYHTKTLEDTHTPRYIATHIITANIMHGYWIPCQNNKSLLDYQVIFQNLKNHIIVSRMAFNLTCFQLSLELKFISAFCLCEKFPVLLSIVVSLCNVALYFQLKCPVSYLSLVESSQLV